MRMGLDIPSRTLAKLLPFILIAKPISHSDDARIRLAGTALIERFGRDVPGELASHLYAADTAGAQLLLQLARHASRTREPGMIDLRVLMDEIEVFHLETVLVPIYSPDGSTGWTMGRGFFGSRPQPYAQAALAPAQLLSRAHGFAVRWTVSLTRR
jgi:hypothetical protein